MAAMHENDTVRKAFYCALLSIAQMFFLCSEVYNKCIVTQMGGQYGQLSHSCVVLPLPLTQVNICTLMQAAT